MALGLTQPLTEISTRRISWVKGNRCWHDNLTTFMGRLSWNLRALITWNPHGLSRLVMVLLTFIYTVQKRSLSTEGIKIQWFLWNDGIYSNRILLSFRRNCFLHFILEDGSNIVLRNVCDHPPDAHGSTGLRKKIIHVKITKIMLKFLVSFRYTMIW
jgi:hypothetical protein